MATKPHIFLILEKSADLQSRWKHVDYNLILAFGAVVRTSAATMWERIGDSLTMPAEGDIVVLMSQESEKLSEVVTLLTSLCTALDASPFLRVFCHYGNDIFAGEVSWRWMQLSNVFGLDNRAADQLVAANGGIPPLPFSHGQSSKWGLPFVKDPDLNALRLSWQKLSRTLTLDRLINASAASTPFLCALQEPNFAGQIDALGALEFAQLAFDALPSNLDFSYREIDFTELEGKLIYPARNWWDALDAFIAGVITHDPPNEEGITELRKAGEVYASAVGDFIRKGGARG
jgi:hypothetical protein